MKAITFNKENECNKQEGVVPADVIYVGKIDEITDTHLAEWGIGYNDLAELLKNANGAEDEEFVVILLSHDGL